MHWARWGDPSRATQLPEAARALVEAAFGPVQAVPPAELGDVRLPAVGLAETHLDGLRELVGSDDVLLDHESRVRHTRGTSTSDLLRIRAGDGSDAPDAVVRPAGHEEVAAVVEWCSRHGVALVPFGGGTSVVGGLTARREGYAGVVALDLCRLKRMVDVDTESSTATLEAGLLGPEAEALLAPHGLTLGHFPQSFEYASIGGFAATRSSGQASSGYGRFDEMVVGVQMATPVGTLRLGRAPASASGPDLRQLVLGSEGAFGVITSVMLRVRERPALTSYAAWSFPTFADGMQALRRLVQAGGAPAVLRLSDEAESAINLSRPDAMDAESSGGAQLVVGYEAASPGEMEAGQARVDAMLRACGAVAVDDGIGEAWAESRFDGPYLRDALLDLGVLVETVETAAFWGRLPTVYADVRTALENTLGARGAPVIVLCHISHVYETGASLYFTVAAKQAVDPLAQWAEAKRAATEAMVAAGATITHHHAVGRDHMPWLADELGDVGQEILRAVKQRLDPAGVLNPGVLVP